MKKLSLNIFLLILLVSACGEKKKSTSKYLRMIGDIVYNETIDDPDFQLCKTEDYAVQYYTIGGRDGLKTYKGENYEIMRIFKERYDDQNVKRESGLVRIRFLVNCHGKAGRFRMIAMDQNYQEKLFDTGITNQLMAITKSLDGWMPYPEGNYTRDYYQYLIFKIEDGKLVEIIP